VDPLSGKVISSDSVDFLNASFETLGENEIWGGYD